MNIKDLENFKTKEEYYKWSKEYEKKYQKFSISNEKIANSSVNVFLNWFPSLLRGFVFQIIKCFFDDGLLNSFGYTKPNIFLKFFIDFGNLLY
jgi:hypothetical protein